MQASAELLDLRIAALHGQLASSEASLQHQGSEGPAAAQADSNPTSLVAGVTSTAAVRPGLWKLEIHSTWMLMFTFWLDTLEADPCCWHPMLTQQPAVRVQEGSPAVEGCPEHSPACWPAVLRVHPHMRVCWTWFNCSSCCRVGCRRVLLHQAYMADLVPPCLQVMELAEQLTAVCQERLQLGARAKDPEPAIVASLEAASKRQQFLEQQLDDAQERTTATQAEKETGEAFRGTGDRKQSYISDAWATEGPVSLVIQAMHRVTAACCAMCPAWTTSATHHLGLFQMLAMARKLQRPTAYEHLEGQTRAEWQAGLGFELFYMHIMPGFQKGAVQPPRWRSSRRRSSRRRQKWLIWEPRRQLSWPSWHRSSLDWLKHMHAR